MIYSFSSTGLLPAFNTFSLLVGQLCTGSLPSMLELPFKKAFLGTPSALLNHHPVFHTYHLSKIPKVSQSQLAAACLHPGADRSLSLSGTLLLGFCCCSYGCAACCVCECSLHLTDFVYPGHFQPGYESSMPWEGKEPQSFDF